MKCPLNFTGHARPGEKPCGGIEVRRAGHRAGRDPARQESGRFIQSARYLARTTCPGRNPDPDVTAARETRSLTTLTRASPILGPGRT